MLKMKLLVIVNKSDFLSYLKLKVFQKKWRRLNSHNFTTAGNAFNARRVKVGNGTYGELYVRHFGSDDEDIQIGSYVSIAPGCRFISGGEHKLDAVSTYPFRVKYGKAFNESFSKGPIIIDDDVWIGYGVTILSGVHIGQGAVVAAGSVVTSNIEAYSIVGGVPAKRIRYRFPGEIIKELMRLDFTKLDNPLIETHIEELSSKLTDMSQLDWFPRKQD